MTLAEAEARLRAAGVPTPRVDAELLLSHVLGRPRSQLALARPTPDEAARFAALVERRAARVPLQHLTGTAPFRHLELAVGPGVFVPRPETELLIDAVLPALTAGALAVDLCAGTGALALSIALEAPGVEVLAVESSADALTWLRHNAAAATAVTVVAGDVRDSDLLADRAGAVDVVVSNPPYVPAATPVDPEVRADPPEAVFAGGDGLAVIPAVIDRAAALLRPGGRLAVEHDASHGAAVTELVRGCGAFTEVVDHPDLSGRARFVTARRCGRHR